MLYASINYTYITCLKKTDNNTNAAHVLEKERGREEIKRERERDI